jgi:hypothetical protein
MATGSNKLVDKYQYNDSQTKTDGFGKNSVIMQLK